MHDGIPVISSYLPSGQIKESSSYWEDITSVKKYHYKSPYIDHTTLLVTEELFIDPEEKVEPISPHRT